MEKAESLNAILERPKKEAESVSKEKKDVVSNTLK